MTKKLLGVKFILACATLLGVFLVAGIPEAAFAKSSNTPEAKVQVQNAGNEKLLLEKQSQIDKYIFEEHAGEIKQKGFKVTHTGQANGYVEIGITPFNKENADYLYKIFGDDIVKVVKGEQAVLMNDMKLKNEAIPDKTDSFNVNGLLIFVIPVLAAIILIAIKIRTKKAWS